MNFFTKFLEKTRSKQTAGILAVLKKTCGTLDQLEKSGLIAFDKKNRRLFIEQALAALMLRNEESWGNFMHNCFTWLYMRQSREAWETYILKEELKAVRRAKKKVTLLTRKDVERIRRARRGEIGLTDMEPPKVEPFEFFVIRDDAEAVPENKDDRQKVAGGVIVAVGNYNPQTEKFEIAEWEEIKAFMEQK